MINIIKKCMAKSKITHEKWDYHLAFLHFGKCKNVFRNGKPLKWYNILKRGDHIEVLEKPQDPVTIGALILGMNLSLALADVGLAWVVTAVGVLAIVGVAGAVVTGIGALARSSASTASGSSQKQYSSSSQPELSGGSNDTSNSIIPVLFGKTQQTPNYAQLPYRLVGDGNSTNKFRQYFIANYNNVVYSNYKLGDTLIDNYSPNYVSVTTSYGGTDFIGFENCKSVDVNEELGYDKDGAVLNVSIQEYDSLVVSDGYASGTFIFSPVLSFENVDIANWGTKAFSIEIQYKRYNTSTGVTTSATYTTATGNILSSELTHDSGNNYHYGDDYTVYSSATNHIYYVDKVTITPTLNTRSNIQETIMELKSIYSRAVFYAGFPATFTRVYPNAQIDKYTGELARIINTSPENTTEIDIIFSFPQGLYHLNTSSAARNARTVNVSIEYKEFTETSWHTISEANALYYRDLQGVKQPLSGSTTTVAGSIATLHSPTDLNVADQLFFRPIGFELPSGKYIVRVCAGELTTKTNYDIGVPYCAEVQFRVDDDIINTDILPNVNQIAFEATAYKGLSGTLKKFNYIGEAEIPIWNGANWNTISTTTNPAAIVRFLLTDVDVNPRAIPENYIDNDSLVEYYNWCETESYKISGITTDEIKILEIINDILANTQTAMIPLLNGKHVFATDKPNKIPTFMFNQHNSWDFKWIPTVGEQTDAIRAAFLDNDNYTTDELTKYWYNNQANDEPESGKTDDDYTIIKKEYKYVNDRASVEKIVEYELERMQTKRNTFELTTNLEALNMTLLDRGYISNTTNMQNESTGLIKEVITSEENLIGFRLYSEIEIPTDAKIVIRSLDHENEISVINVYDVTNIGTQDIVSIEPIPYDGIIQGKGQITGKSDSWDYDGDLFTLGQDTVYDCTITDIKYGEDNTATLTAREY